MTAKVVLGAALALLVCWFAFAMDATAADYPRPGSGIARLGEETKVEQDKPVRELSPEVLRTLPPDVQARVLAEQRERADRMAREKAGIKEGEQPLRPGSRKPVTDQDPQLADDLQLDDESADLLREQREISRLEEHYRRDYASLLAEEVSQFGYDFFAHTTPKPSRFAVPDSSYVLGPGDRLRIRVWGADVDAEFTGMVDPNGTINVPRIGIVPVAGVRFGDIGQVVRREAEKYLQGINISVAIEELRSVEVYVVGSVNRPGLHLIPAFSTVLDSLLVADGPRKSGSLRQVRLYRNGKFLKEIDLYQLLLAGDRSRDQLLENRDVIFVPRLAATAAVVGAAKEEAIFEITEEKTIGELLELAGGYLPQAFTGRIHLRRYLDNQEFIIKDIDTRRDQQWAQVAIKDGDLLELQALKTEMPKVVRLEGHVWRPDVFRHEPGLSLQQVLSARDLLKPGAVMEFALLHRFDNEAGRYTVQRIALEQVLQQEEDLALLPYDRIEILSRELLGMEEKITVQGSVWNPGEYPFRPGLTVADAVAIAGGERFGAQLDRIELSRQLIVDSRAQTSIHHLNLAEHGHLALQPFDYIMIPKVKDATLTKTVQVTGEVRFPGTYRISGHERISELLERAGGVLPDAYYFGVRYTTAESRNQQQAALDRMARELEMRSQTVLHEQAQSVYDPEDVAMVQAGQQAIAGLINRIRQIEPEGRVSMVMTEMDLFRGSVYDVELEHGDTVNIPRRPNFVTVTGSVFSAGSFVHLPGKTVADYLRKSGGPTKGADRKNMYVIRANGEVVSASQSGRFFNSFNNYQLMPGDMIVVPENLERVPHMRLVRDISDILFKIATTAGVALAVL